MLTTTPAKPQKGEAARVNDRFEVSDESFAERLWGETGLRELVTGKGRDTEGSVEGWGGDVCGLNPRIRIYRYGKGQFFSKHCMWVHSFCTFLYTIQTIPSISNSPITKTTSDWAKLPLSNIFLLDDDSNAITLSNRLAAKTTWTLLIYLSTCVGGETVFYPEAPSKSKQKLQDKVEVQPEAGMALLHKHGQECLLHEGLVVEDGEKWVIRSDLCVKR